MEQPDRGKLNLARLWRSRQFEEVVGQPFVIKILKNSLYKQLFFPVYLFAGPRGTGKTTTARIFAAAVNCAVLDAFTQDARLRVPCLACVSCKAFFNQEHPDCIEIDGASNTSVDNVRALIEAASFLPSLGRKRIYLIDEAHMLSKAAWNAFLKILEEPPATTLFILATTDPHKIIDTVLSRCFQLFFQPLAVPVLLAHLQEVCQAEAIAFGPGALERIAQYSQGSARDALNMLERVRYLSDPFTEQDVMATLGFMGTPLLLQLIKALLRKQQEELIAHIRHIAQQQVQFSLLWQSWLELLSVAIELKAQLPAQEFGSFLLTERQELKELIQDFSLLQLNGFRMSCFSYEAALLKTGSPFVLFETLLLQLSASAGEPHKKEVKKTVAVAPMITAPGGKWELFLAQAPQRLDSLVISLFKQALVKASAPESKSLLLCFPRTVKLFEAQLEASRTVWQPLLEELYGSALEIITEFNGEQSGIKTALGSKTGKNSSSDFSVVGSDIVLSDEARAIVSVFPGTVTLIKE